MSRSACIPVAIAAVLALAACGGGGDSGPSLTAPTSGAVIDSQSAPVIAAGVAAAVAGSEDLGALGAFSLPAAPQGFTSAGTDVPQVLATTFGPESVECENGGSATLSGTLAVSNSITVGDTLIFHFDVCDHVEDGVLDGRLEFEIVAFSGDVATGVMTLTVSMKLEAFNFGSAAGEESLDGDLSFTIDTTNVPETFIGISSTVFTIVSATGSVTLRDFIVTLTLDPTLATLTIDSSATLSASSWEGDVSYVTSESLRFAGDGTAQSGLIVVTGAGDATLTIRLKGADLVDLELDADGNGTVDEVVMTTWSELLD